MARRINLSENPSCKTTSTGNATDWTSSPSGYARQTGLTGMDRTTGFGGTGAKDVVTTPRFAAIAGQSYVASVQVKTGASNTFKLLINWYSGTTASGTFISNSGTSVPFTVNGTSRCEIGPYTAPTGAGAGYLRIIEVDNTSASFGAVIVEQTSSTSRTYFDGDSTSPKATWEGTSGNSASDELTGTDAFTMAASGVKADVAPGPTGSDTLALSESATGVASGAVTDYLTFAESAMIIGLGYDDRRGRVRISAFGLPTTAVRAVVKSRTGRGRYVEVRGGRTSVSSGAFDRTIDDYEFTAGRDIDYQITAYSTPEGVTDAVAASAFATLSGVNPQVWLKFIAAPSLNQKVQLVGWSNISRSSRNASFDVIGRSDPIVVTDVHSSRQLQVELRTATIESGDALDRALSAGNPAFLHTPVTLALPSMYVAIGDHSYDRPNAYSLVRRWTVGLVEVAAPPASVYGPATTCQSILDAYESCDDLLDAFDTCLDLVS